ncbi:MAG: hypothetical protein PUI22_05090, partial [Bacteroidales bacterium]|nr:hypothetical protein [Bacteroidales bacterium]MDY5262003.1 hypothetical protein [Candidatus Cryptobacteroides sp.]
QIHNGNQNLKGLFIYAILRYVNCEDLFQWPLYAIRRLKFKRCGELASRLSSRLTFAWGCVAVRAIHSSRCISAGLLLYFIQAGITAWPFVQFT